MVRALSHHRAGQYQGKPFDHVELTHDARHLRRRLITLASGLQVLVDLPRAVALEQGDVLVLEDGRLAEIRAADEDLLEIRGIDATHLARLCWHIGNRHLPAEIGESRILIAADHVMGGMLEGLGASVRPVRGPFSPERGAYHGHSH